MRKEEKKGLNLRDQNTRNYFVVITVISLVFTAFELIPYLIFRSSFPFLDKTASFFLIGSVSFISIIASFICNYAILRPFEKTGTSAGYRVLAAFLVSFLVIIAFGLINVITVHPFGNEYPRMLLPRSFFISMISTVYTYIARLNFQKQSFELENEILKKESIKGQYEALKNEISPHFLFNSLNALQNIIRENPGNADKYVHHLSQVLRYTLQRSDNHTVTLQQELELAESYMYLLEMRYENNLTFHIEVPEEARSLKILPLTLQSLIENAIKHNEISSRNPLTIHIAKGKGCFLTVSNKLQQKSNPEPSLGIGLSNLSKRYKIITGEDILITRESGQFMVEVPLIAK